MRKGQYEKGNKPWNTGKKGIHLSPATEFKEGEKTGESHPSWLGGIHMMQKDCAYVWDGANKRQRRPRKVYEENFGPIPTGYLIIHKDGNRYNDSPNNLEAISRAENMRRNKNRN